MKTVSAAIGLCWLSACAGHTSFEAPSGELAGSVVLHQELEAFWLDDTRLYWLAHSGALRSCLKDHCAGEGQLTYEQAAFVVALGADHLFWSPQTPGWSILTCPKTGWIGAPSVVFRTADGGGFKLYGDGAHVYWATSDGIYRCQFTGCGATAEVVAAEAAFGELTFSADDVYWISWGGKDNAAPNTPPRIRRAAKDGSQPATTVVAHLTQSPADYPPSSVLVDGVNVYWVGDSNHIVSCPIAGCGDSPARQVVTSNDVKTGLQMDVTGLYFQQPDLSGRLSIRYCPVSGCSTNAVTLTENNVRSFALDASDVYWADTDPSDGWTQNIRRIAKPTR